ncbi:YkvI family membrane protein [Dehalobacterium formicoaceticum]|uniref:YkvI family membrane protein n=1 Tax=Dehalobacterium formicoaceticum TaxID=51515 RepID=UPI000B7E3413|nr:hypothetical protein [Dehalobacterium formicoaceticum]
MKTKALDWQIAAVYIGTVIGAGFASGQELMQFFVRFSIKGLYGVLLTGLAFTFFGGIIIYLTKLHGFHTYKDFLNWQLGTRMTGILDIIILIFLFLGFSVMLSGSGALFEEQLGLPKIMGIIITQVLVVLSLMARDEGVLWFNSILIPILVIILTVVSGISLFSAATVNQGSIFDPFADSLVVNNWVLSSFLYIAYNMINVLVVLVALTADKKETSPWGGVMGGFILSLISLLIVAALLAAGETIYVYQIPMLYLAYQVSPIIFYFYGVVLWGAMITTAVADAYGLCQRLSYAWSMPYNLILLIVVILSIPFAMYDFTLLVSKVYPVFGFMGLAVTMFLIGKGVVYLFQLIGLRLKRLF